MQDNAKKAAESQAMPADDEAVRALSPSPFLKKFAASILHSIIVFIVGGACTIAALPFLLLDSTWLKLVFAMLLPLIVPVSMIGLCALINKPFQQAIRSGLFPRDLSLPLYFGRRVYGTCLATLMNFSGLYYLILSMPLLKKAMFRSFGYEGAHCNFTTYTDVWMRDLKLLELGDGAYIGNQSTLGTNICTTDGNILVGKIKIGDGTQLGRLCVVGPGVRIGSKSETGVKTVLGIRTIARNRVKIAGGTGISHGVMIEDEVEIAEGSYIGSKVHLHAGIKLPVCSNIKAGSILLTQDDVEKYIQNQTLDIQAVIKSRLQMLSDNPLDELLA